MGLTTYGPEEGALIFGAPITGYADGTFISIEQNEDDFTLTVGADGDACRAKTNNKSARMTITLLQSSASNDALSVIRGLDITTPSGDGILPFIWKDLSGRTFCVAEKAWIVKPPTVVYSRGVEAREWVLETDAMLWNVGGNS